MIKKVLTFAVIFACSFVFAQNAEIRIMGKDKKITTKQVALTKNADGSLRFKFSRNDIPKDAIELAVIPEFMTAQKGDKGFWLFPRGEMGKFTQQKGLFSMGHHLVTPIYAMQSKAGTYMGYVKTLRFELVMVVKAENGKYELYPNFRLNRMGFAPYDDVIIDFYKLEGKDANYSGVGRLYRKMQLATGEFKTIRERMKTRPWLETMAYAIPIRIQFHGAKNADKVKDVTQTKENEPKLIPVMPFDKTVEFVKAIKNAGVDKIAVCSAGWQSGGYDGRFPQLFPINEELGGEKGLKAMTKALWDMGVPASCHTNSTDCYQVADIWSEDLVCKNPDGSLQRGGVWSGGRSYHLCTKRIWQMCLRDQLRLVKEMGFDGSHYIDVFSAVYPNFCCDPKHPATRKEMGELQVEIAKFCVDLFGGFSSECGYDHVGAQLDYCNYVSASMRGLKNKPNPMVERVVPLWEIVYHGFILGTPDRLVQNHTRGKAKYKNLSSADLRFMEGCGITDIYNSLKIVEFGGRPIFYTSHMRDVPYIKRAFDEFKPVRHLQLELMYSHDEIAKNVYLTVYEDGSKIISNYNNTSYPLKGITITSKSSIKNVHAKASAKTSRRNKSVEVNPMSYVLINPDGSVFIPKPF